MTITTDLRLRAASRQEADHLAVWLVARLGDAVQLTAPHIGREDGVWFVRGTLRIDSGQPALVEAIIRDTGELVSIPDPRPVRTDDPQAAARLARLAGLSRPETRPDDGVDRRELHQRMRELKEKEQPS